MYRLLLTDGLPPEGLALLRAAADAQIDDLKLSRAETQARLGEYDAWIIRSGTSVDRELIERGTRLKVIGRVGTKFDNIDLEAATRRGVMVMNTPEPNSLAAAEHTLAMLLALCRNLPAADAALRRGEWERQRFLGVQLHRKTLGIIGFGRVGRHVAHRALNFEMDVLAYDPYVDTEIFRQMRVTAVTFDELLAHSDFITLHAALTPETQELIGEAEIARMKAGVRFINCSRGELVNERALHAALVSGKIAGAALDVFIQEPPTGNPLLQLPAERVVVAPRLGASTVEAQRDVSTQIAQQVLDALRGTDYQNVVNLPFIPSPDFHRARPYLELAEKIGALQSQLAEGPVRSVEVEVKGEDTQHLVKPVAVALLKGLLSPLSKETVNYVNAPLLAEERGLVVSQTRGLEMVDYPNMLSCRVSWDSGQRLVAGTLFGGVEGRIVQMDDIRMDVRPQGHVLVTLSQDVPGVIGAVGTLLYQYGVNIAEWRLGRNHPGGTAVSFINLDDRPSAACLTALGALPQIISVRILEL